MVLAGVAGAEDNKPFVRRKHTPPKRLDIDIGTA